MTQNKQNLKQNLKFKTKMEEIKQNSEKFGSPISLGFELCGSGCIVCSYFVVFINGFAKIEF